AVAACAAAFCAGVLGGGGPKAPAAGPKAQASATPSAAQPASSGTAGASPSSTAKPATPATSSKPLAPCDNTPPLAHPYTGLLQTARCDYDRFPIMADVATMLGCECNHCHVSDPNDKKKEIYPLPTHKKDIANWMKNHLMKAIKPADGS